MELFSSGSWLNWSLVGAELTRTSSLIAEMVIFYSPVVLQRNHEPDKSHILSPSHFSSHSDRGTWLMSHSTRTMERKVLLVNFSNSLFTCSLRHFSCCSWSGFCTCTQGYHSINIIIFIGTSIIHKKTKNGRNGTISSLFTWSLLQNIIILINKTNSVDHWLRHSRH